MKATKDFSIVLMAAAFSVVASSAVMAAPVKAPLQQQQCSIANVTTSTACQTVLDNNYSVGDMNGFNAGVGVFNVTNWMFGGKSAGDNDPVAPFNLSASPNDVKSGVWSVAGFDNWTKAALVVKGGSEAWVAYLLDVTKLSGTWNTNDIFNSGGQQPNISHMSLYVGGQQVTPPPPAPISLPAAGVLLVGALGGLAALRRRKARA